EGTGECARRSSAKPGPNTSTLRHLALLDAEPLHLLLCDRTWRPRLPALAEVQCVVVVRCVARSVSAGVSGARVTPTVIDIWNANHPGSSAKLCVSALEKHNDCPAG